MTHGTESARLRAMNGTLKALVQVVTLALDNGITPDTVAMATRHGSREELALYLALNGETVISERLLTRRTGEWDER